MGAGLSKGKPWIALGVTLLKKDCIISAFLGSRVAILKNTVSSCFYDYQALTFNVLILCYTKKVKIKWQME